MSPLIIIVGVVVFILGCFGVYSYVQEFRQKMSKKRGKKESGKDAKSEYIRKVKKVQ